MLLKEITSYFCEGWDFKGLKKNQISLSVEERKIVMDSDAVWHHGPNGEATPAVWKSSDSKGNEVFITNTHRAGAVEKTLKSAINKYHNFIKGTA
jgi:hypothetical protein